jgi:hypothetical protein
MIEKLGGTLVEIKSDKIGLNSIDKISNNNVSNNHISESGFYSKDCLILENNGSIEDLYHTIDGLMGKMLKQ